jgi:hypothetical protein
MNARQRRELTIIIALIVAVLVVYYVMTALGPKQTTQVIQTPGKPVTIRHRGALAKVGDMTINADELDKRVGQFLKFDPYREEDSKGVNLLMTRMNAFQELVERAILTQEAKKYNITVTEKEVDEAVDPIIKKFGGKEGLEKVLSAQHGFTIEMLREAKRSDIIMQKLYDTVTKDVKIDEAKYKADYAKMKAQWAKKKDMGTMRTPDEFRAQYLNQLRAEKFSQWRADVRKDYKIEYYDQSLQPTEIAGNMPNPHTGMMTTPVRPSPHATTGGQGAANAGGKVGSKEQPKKAEKSAK